MFGGKNMVCNNCGRDLKPGCTFCEHCGEYSSTTDKTALAAAENSKEIRSLIPAFILSVVSIMLAFNFDYYQKWYITLIFLIFSIIGYIIGMIALSKGLKSKRPLVPLATISIVLAIIGISCCGLSIIIDLNRLIEFLF